MLFFVVMGDEPETAVHPVSFLKPSVPPAPVTIIGKPVDIFGAPQ